MANQLALLVHCRRGDEVIVGEGAHNANYESGAGGAIAGVQFAVAGRGGLFDVAAMLEAVKPVAYYYPRTRLVSVENTHNRAGGRIWPAPQSRAVAEAARERGMLAHLDGARLMNAVVASGVPAAEWAAPFDSVSLCLSKGLGAPVGSLLAGARAFVDEAHRLRKMLGGGMRQAGVLAAAGLFALDHHVARLAEDHENARRFASLVAAGLSTAVATAAVASVAAPETNIVMVDVAEGAGVAADEVVRRARERGLLVSAMGPRRVRAVTHLDASADACARGAQVLAGVLRELA
jgi:threonine aldolase